MQMQLFHSCSQEDPSFNHRTMNSDLGYLFSPPVEGLIFCRNNTKAMIGNPSTGQFVSLLRGERTYYLFLDMIQLMICTKCCARRQLNVDHHVFNWEGPMWEESMSEEHQVFTLGAKQKWRMLECKYTHRHYPRSQGICWNGVVYYLASFNDKRSLMSFDLRSEDFNVIKLLKNHKLQEYGKLVDHTGKITIMCHASNGLLDLWVLEDANKGEWSTAAAVIPSIEDLVGNREHVFSGILGIGEIILVPLLPPNTFFFLCYDPKEKNARKVVIESIGEAAHVRVFFDYVESHMVLTKVS
ncbi:F-box associated ubiquitination effector family protein [Arabidopsis thaliana]|uniref:F-box associated ubiquitination effector family protein n=1 Tax=Arabidopsis thaliana TaxID=3702 RepID=Q9SIT4_ARATH|nr:F-box associated ubiquitination effector family protein [Arabidopsis thaliana]AAD22685.1 hypothetical protein [Arabidopsis thaliana]AEC06248.1 F-box associated ubiquitination effector family protein [Arabidopsis thaliana]|eukprot:NP_178986.1 F-box associated ubiquitination effector family protein [Arabidopsis thaliana]